MENHCSIGNSVQAVPLGLVGLVRLLGYHFTAVEQVRVDVICGDEEWHVPGGLLLVGVVVNLDVEDWVLGWVVGD